MRIMTCTTILGCCQIVCRMKSLQNEKKVNKKSKTAIKKENTKHQQKDRAPKGTIRPDKMFQN